MNNNQLKTQEELIFELPLLSKIIKATTYLYKHDGTAPNVLFSLLPNNKVYLAISRYNNPDKKKKRSIVFKTTKSNIKEVIIDAMKWLSNQTLENKNPIEELKEIINKTKPDYYY